MKDYDKLREAVHEMVTLGTKAFVEKHGIAELRKIPRTVQDKAIELRLRGVTVGDGNPTPEQIQNEINKAIHNISIGDYEEVEL